jgi:hypothetical protein
MAPMPPHVATNAAALYCGFATLRLCLAPSLAATVADPSPPTLAQLSPEISADDLRRHIALAAQWLKRSGHDLKTWQDGLDTGTLGLGFEFADLTLAATIDIQHEKRLGRNVLVRMYAAERPAASLVIIGARVDHLGRGLGTNSLARGEEKGLIHS